MNKYLDDFMKTFPYEGLTYDDVTLVTQYADFLPDDASLETKLTSRTTMKIPFISAAMDTVTEAPMAIAMAIAGGIGVIHKNLEEDDQAKEVAKVKNYLNGMIAKPICFHANDDISFLRSEKKRMGLKFNGFPVLDSDDRLGQEAQGRHAARADHGEARHLAQEGLRTHARRESRQASAR